MALEKKNQKGFYLSSEKIKRILDERLNDLSYITDRTTSYCIEDILIKALLPKNAEARQLVENCLYDEDYIKSNDAVKLTLEGAFEDNATGIDWLSKHENYRPLVECCYEICQKNAHCEDNEDKLYHFISCFDSVVTRIKDCTSVCIEIADRKNYEHLCELAETYLQDAKEKPERIVFRQHFELILGVWDMVKDSAHTYRYLTDLVSMNHNWPNDPVTRSHLCDVIDQISKEWDAENTPVSQMSDNGKTMLKSTILFQYSESQQFRESVEIMANEANIGILQLNSGDPETILWSPGLIPTDAVKFMLRKEDTFCAVADELRHYKNEHGYKYIAICTYNYGFASYFSKKFLEAHGFHNLPNRHPALFYLE